MRYRSVFTLSRMKSWASVGYIAVLLIALVTSACTRAQVETVSTGTSVNTPVSTPTGAPTSTPTSTATSTLASTPTQAATQAIVETTDVEIAKKPLITHIYTADPAVHVFKDKLYIYPSHDLDHDNPPSTDGGQYDMVDYHVFSLENMHSLPVDHGQVLHVDDVPWAEQQMWAPDAAFKNDTYYLYFPAKDYKGIFRIGVALGESPTGPFIPQPEPIPGSFSIDPSVFVDDDGQAYMYFGGLWGGQLEKWRSGQFDPQGVEPDDREPALGPRVARLSSDMLSIDGPAEQVSIIDKDGRPLLAGDNARRFFEAAGMHKYDGVYYLSYSTGDTHFIAYATSESPTGPFVFRGYILDPVVGWTTHHSIVDFQGKWYLFYHDSSLSGGISHKRCVKVAELVYNADGSIQKIEP